MERKLCKRSAVSPEKGRKAGVMRKLAAALLTTTSLMLPGCSMVRNWGVETPVPSQLTGSVQGERDWYGLASHITDSSVFRHFEPIVAEMAGIPPVPADRINLVSDEELERICRPDAGGCYRINKEDIHIGEAIYSPGESENRMGGALCPVQERPSLSRNNRLAVWLHEQAHHFDDYYARRRINRWPDEIEAEAFVLYFGEHMARHYDRRLGVDIIHVKAYRQVWDRIDSAEDGIRLANELIADYPGERNPGRDTTLGRLSIIALLGSGEFDSFGDVWYYVHTHSHRQVMNKVRDNLENMEEGFRMADEIRQDLIGSIMAVPASLDLSYLGSLRFAGHEDANLREFYADSTESTRVSGFIWSARSDALNVHFRHMEDAGTGWQQWRLRIRDMFADQRNPLSRYDIYFEREADGTESLSFYYGASGDINYSMRASDLSGNTVTMIAGSNPPDLTFCAVERLEVETDPQGYVDVFASLPGDLRSSLAGMETGDAIRAVGHIDTHMHDMFRTR